MLFKLIQLYFSTLHVADDAWLIKIKFDKPTSTL